ncbi:MAG: cell division topological specificity factor MinE [Anaerolineae bacterium]|jgi:cell division topological specificity factor
MGILERFRRSRKSTTGEIARERLRLVLACDRAQISPGLLETLKDEIIAAISRHAAIDPDGVEVSFSRGARENRLVAHIPLRTSRKKQD